MYSFEHPYLSTNDSTYSNLPNNLYAKIGNLEVGSYIIIASTSEPNIQGNK